MVKTILITGSSAGIGAEFAKQFHARGDKVVLVARRADRLRQIADDMNKTRSGSAAVLQTDLNSPQSVATCAQFISENQIDVLVNNAGRGSFGYFEELSIAEELRIIALNISATVQLAHAVIPQMKKRRSGAIISIASIAGIQSIPYMATYSGSKAFNLFHSLALREELMSFGINVLAVCPGPVATEFRGVARVPGKPAGASRDTVEDVVRESLSAFDRGSPWLVPCFRAKLMSLPGRFLPRVLAARIAERALRSSLRESP